MAINLSISKTTNYDQFKQIKSNREINMKHVRELVDSITDKNLLHLNPLICNEDLEVIDGQHRLEAARILKAPIYYVIEKGLTEDDICHVNRNQKNWAPIDYITFYTLKKKPGFDVLMRFMRKHKLDWSTAVRLLSGSSSTDRKSLVAGRLDVSNQTQAEKIMEYIEQLIPYGGFVITGKFLGVMMKMINDDTYDQDLLIRSLKKNKAGWEAQARAAKYREMIEGRVG